MKLRTSLSGESNLSNTFPDTADIHWPRQRISSLYMDKVKSSVVSNDPSVLYNIWEENLSRSGMFLWES